MTVVIERANGPNLLIRFIWWLFIGSWASGIVVAIAWFSLLTIVGIPLGIWLINRLPTVLTLRPRARVWTMGQDAGSDRHLGGRPASDRVAAPRAVVRPRRLVASAIWMAVAWFAQLTVIGLPLALLMFNRTPFVASLYRY